MIESPLDCDRLLALRVLSPGMSAEVRDLYLGGVSGPVGLPVLDLLTLRDLVEFARDADRPGVAPELHALLLSLFTAAAEGSICLRMSRESVERRLGAFLPPVVATAWTTRVLKWWAVPTPAALIADGDDPSPLTGPRYLPLVRRSGPDADRLYLHKFYTHERLLRQILTSGRSAGNKPVAPVKSIRAVVEAVLLGNPLMLGGSPVRLNADQKDAVGLAMLRGLSVVSGGPGTGKTSIVLTLVRCLVRLGIEPTRIRIAAPTGRAAQRVTDSLHVGKGDLRDPSDPADARLDQISGATIHRLLGFNASTGGFRHDADDPLPADVVIVDEASMVDVVLMSRLLGAVPADTRVVLLGDKDQLPSVEAGAVLANLLPGAATAVFSREIRENLLAFFEGTDRKEAETGTPERAADTMRADAASTPGPADTIVILRRNYRSQAHIQSIARRVNAPQGDAAATIPVMNLPNREAGGSALNWPALADWSQPNGPTAGGCWRIDPPPDGPAGWRRVLDAWAKRQFLTPDPAGSYVDLLRACRSLSAEALAESTELRRLCDRLSDGRVLTLVREGTWGSQGVNLHLARRLRHSLDPRGAGVGPGGVFFSGSPVMVTRNDHFRQIYNGDVGIVLRDATGQCRAYFRRGGKHAVFAIDSLPGLELAFAVTVHKAQGSEYRQILFVLPCGEEAGTHRLLTKEILYTGITRAKDLAAIYGPLETFKAAISRRVERDAGDDLWSDLD